MISKFRNQHVGEQPWSGKATLDGPGWRGRFHHAVATAACKLRTHMADDLEALGDILQLLGYVLAELAQNAREATRIGTWEIEEGVGDKKKKSADVRSVRMTYRARTDAADDSVAQRIEPASVLSPIA